MKEALILTPYYGGADLEHIACINRMIARGWMQASITGCALLDHAFAGLVGIALKQDRFDCVLFVESDIIFETEEAEAIVATARELDAMVSAPCIIKSPKGKLMCAGLEAREISFGVNGKPEPCWALPLGFTAIPLHWLREVVDRWCPEGPCRGDNGGDIWPVFGSLIQTSETDGHRELMSQDYSFCKRLDAVNCPRYLDTRRRIVHNGAYPYMIEDSCWSVPMVDDLRVRFVDKQVIPIGAQALDQLSPVGLTSCGTHAPIVQEPPGSDTQSGL